MQREIDVTLEDIERVEKSATWMALIAAMLERSDEAQSILENVSAPEYLIRVAQGKKSECDYILAFTERLRAEVTEKAMFEEEQNEEEEEERDVS
jgi:hypothetical protein